MTKRVKQVLKSVGVPAVRWSETYKQYWTRIGFNETRNCNRSQAMKYLGKDQNEAIAKAVALKVEWKTIRKKYGRGATWQSKPQNTDAETAKIDMEGVMAEQTEDAIETEPGLDWRTPTIRIEQVQELYCEYRQAKGLAKAATLKNESINLKNAIAAFDGKFLMSNLGYPQIEQWRDAILRRERAGAVNRISRRTANNYLAEMHRMLTWASRTPTIPYRHPQDVEVLFAKLRNATPIDISEYDRDLMEKLVKAASDRVRLYIYLALNCGAYQGDISSLRCSEVQKDKAGRPCIVRKRNKTVHQNHFAAMHTLWGETAKLLKGQWAAKNPMGLALLNENGKELVRKVPSYDGIAKAYNALTKKLGIDLPFKQLRKIGASAINRIGGSDAMRLYKAGVIGKGDKVYIIDSYEKLTPHLLAWGEELRKDGVLF